MSKSSHAVSSPVRCIIVSLALSAMLAGSAIGQIPQGVIQGTVLCDTNPLPGIDVMARMVPGPGIPVSGVTDSNGFYSLSVPAGFHEITLAGVPAGSAYVTPPDGTNRTPVAPGVVSPANFSLTGCEPAELSALGGMVWLDLDCDGIRHPDEPGVSAVPVRLLDCQAAVLDEIVTDEEGVYVFEELPAGPYSLQFLAPACRVFTHYQQGYDPEYDSDADPEFGVTECVTLAAGVTDVTWDAGLCKIEGPGTRSQGFWKNHPLDWPMDEIEIGGMIYDRHTAIAIMCQPTKGNKRLNMFEQLVAAKLNRALCNESPCIDEVIACADSWMEENPGVVRANSPAWKCLGSYLHCLLEAYNTGDF